MADRPSAEASSSEPPSGNRPGGRESGGQEPKGDSSNGAGREPGRLAARLSNLAAYVCFALNCSFNMLTAKDAVTPWWLRQTIGWLSLAVVLGGIGLGGYAAIVAWKRRSFETVGIASLGIAMNVGIIALAIWVLAMLAKVQP